VATVSCRTWGIALSSCVSVANSFFALPLKAGFSIERQLHLERRFLDEVSRKLPVPFGSIGRDSGCTKENLINFATYIARPTLGKDVHFDLADLLGAILNEGVQHEVPDSDANNFLQLLTRLRAVRGSWRKAHHY
jgi:hypothetical protein